MKTLNPQDITRNSYKSINPVIMNKNNVEELKKELKELRFDAKLGEAMEQQMGMNSPEFQLRSHLNGDKGQVDFNIHFKKSNQSDFYYLNKYDVVLNTVRPLDEGQKYMVISVGENNKPVFRNFESQNEAIVYFKNQTGDSELAIGKDPAYKTSLATMESGKVKTVRDDFRKAFYSPAIVQTFYVEKGKGFTAEQAANLIQGRAVYRDDLLSLAGMAYKAWVKLDFDKPKDRHNNFTTNQYHDPSYGFDLQKTLDKYDIRELNDPKQQAKLLESLKNGNRPLVTTQKDGEMIKLHVEAVPRYGNVNFYNEKGKVEKREQFEKSVKVANPLSKGKGKTKEMSESQGMRV